MSSFMKIRDGLIAALEDQDKDKVETLTYAILKLAKDDEIAKSALADCLLTYAERKTK